MKIYTLNVNGFRGSSKVIKDKITEEELDKNLRDLKVLVDMIICDEDSLIILQEIPHKIYDKSIQPWQWIDNVFYKKFNTIFSSEYKIMNPKHLIDSNQCTVALCKKVSLWEYIDNEIIEYDSKHSFGNKLVELQYNEKITLLGLHMNPTDEMWKMIFDSYHNNKHTFIVGDFNAYELRGDMKYKPQQLRNLGFNSFIPNDVITYYIDNSSIDNFYIDTCFNLRIISVNVIKLDTFETDHALCIIELVIP